MDMSEELSLSLLTVKMLLFRSDHLLRGGLANRLGEALTGDAVPRGQQPVVDRLSRHTVPLSHTVNISNSQQQQFTYANSAIYPARWSCSPRTQEKREMRARARATRGILTMKRETG